MLSVAWVYEDVFEGLPEPEDSIVAFMVKVVAKNNITSDIVIDDTLNDTERKVITEIFNDNKVTADAIALNTGLAISTVKRYLIAMQKKKLIAREGSKKQDIGK